MALTYEPRGDDDFRDVCETVMVEFRIMLPLPPKPVALSELLDAEGGGHVRQVVFVAGEEDFIVPRAGRGVPFPRVFADSVQTHKAHPLGPCRSLCRRHAAFASCD